MQPLFDRDGDRISDLIEAVNQGPGTLDLGPTIPDHPVSVAIVNGDIGSLSNGILLPEEGIGYRHFYGDSSLRTDNWGTLKMIKVIEQVGREWNLNHPKGPRISIGDLSLRQGGHMPGHGTGLGHQAGKDADIRYVRNNYSEGQCDIRAGCDYDIQSTQELIDLLCESGVDLIYADTTSISQLQQPQGCELDKHSYPTDHSNHFHIRIRWP